MSQPRISVPNTHALYDPAFGSAETKRHFSKWLDVGAEIVQYGSDLLLRALQKAEPSLTDLVVIGSMYRQVLVAADGCLTCLENGATQQALLHSRAEFEASLAIHLTLKEHTDRWTAQYYVSSMRQNRSWLRRLVPETPEWKQANKSWDGEGPPPGSNQYTHEQLLAEIADIDRLLNAGRYADINRSFEQYGLIGKGKNQRFQEPKWHQPGPHGIKSIAEMARRVGRETEYDTMYRYLSYFTHGSLADNHFKVREGEVQIEPLRYPKQFSLAFNLTFFDVTQVMVKVTERYRAEERGDLARRFELRWAPALRQFADVTVNPVVVAV